MDVKKFVEKSYILGGHCPECKGFLFTEITQENSLIVTQRCLKCGKIIDITNKAIMNTTTKDYDFNGEELIRGRNKFINWYKNMIIEGIK